MAFFLRTWWKFVRLFFRWIYGSLAWSYDAVAWVVSLGQWTEWGWVALRYLKGPRVLELGHGPGHLQKRMARQGLGPIGLDLSPQMGRLAQRRLRRSDQPARLVQARAQALPFPDQAFSGVVATFPTEYILDPRTVQEVVRVLLPGHNVAIVAMARLMGRDPLSKLIKWLYQVTGQQGSFSAQDTTWKHSLSLRVEEVSVGLSQVIVAVGRRED